MSNELSGRAREILREKNFATVSTLRQDGTVHAVVVWVDADDEGYVLLNTAEGRAWRKNVARDPRRPSSSRRPAAAPADQLARHRQRC